MKLRTITAEVHFPNMEAATLFELYTDATKHAIVTGSSATITDKLGEPFNLYNGFCFGENIDIKQNALIIQSWRTTNWPENADDSTVILRFVEDIQGTTLYLTHADVPETLADSLESGWEDFYWQKWKAFLYNEYWNA